MKTIYSVLYITALYFFSDISTINGQTTCRNSFLATKALPSSSTDLVWKSNKPIEYVYPGEKSHVKITGQVNLTPTRRSEDKGGIAGFFKSKVEWTENHWKTPAAKSPVFPDELKPTNCHANIDGSYECDLSVPVNGEDFISKVIPSAAVLGESELNGSGGPSEGQYNFEFAIDNSQRFIGVNNLIKTNLVRWGGNAAKNLSNLIDKDERLICKYAPQLATTILNEATNMNPNDKQAVLKFANLLDPENNRITIELARTFANDPGGCLKQKQFLLSKNINNVDIDPIDFDKVNNSAMAFDLLAQSQSECSEDFMDGKSLDSLRSYYKIASDQYGMAYDYPKQMSIAVQYANLELQTNDKLKMIDAARFLEKTRRNVPAYIDSVSEAERKAFYGKFGNTHHKYYNDIIDSIHLVYKQQSPGTFPDGVLNDSVDIILKKQGESNLNLTIKYIDQYSVSDRRDGPSSNYKTTWIINCKFDKSLNLSSFKIDSITDHNTRTEGGFATYKISRTPDRELTSALPVAVKAFIQLTNLPRFCPKASISSAGFVEHDMAYFKLTYFTKEDNYGISYKNPCLEFIISKLSNNALMSIKKANQKNNLPRLIINKEVSPVLTDANGNGWNLISENSY